MEGDKFCTENQLEKKKERKESQLVSGSVTVGHFVCKSKTMRGTWHSESLQ